MLAFTIYFAFMKGASTIRLQLFALIYLSFLLISQLTLPTSAYFTTVPERIEGTIAAADEGHEDEQEQEEPLSPESEADRKSSNDTDQKIENDTDEQSDYDTGDKTAKDDVDKQSAGTDANDADKQSSKDGADRNPDQSTDQQETSGAHENSDLKEDAYEGRAGEQTDNEPVS